MEINKRVKSQPKKNLWKPEEDMILKNYVETHGEGNWATVSQQSGYNLSQRLCLFLIFSVSLGLCFLIIYNLPVCMRLSHFLSCLRVHLTGLMRGGKSCRLRWKNYLRPNIKRGGMSQEEEDLIIRMHKLLGNRSVSQLFSEILCKFSYFITAYYCLSKPLRLCVCLYIHLKISPKGTPIGASEKCFLSYTHFGFSFRKIFHEEMGLLVCPCIIILSLQNKRSSNMHQFELLHLRSF